jgi:hypothetical protein
MNNARVEECMQNPVGPALVCAKPEPVRREAR